MSSSTSINPSFTVFYLLFLSFCTIFYLESKQGDKDKQPHRYLTLLKLSMGEITGLCVFFFTYSMLPDHKQMGMRTASDLQSYTEMEKLRQKFKSQIALISINKRFYCARIIVKKITKGKKNRGHSLWNSVKEAWMFHVTNYDLTLQPKGISPIQWLIWKGWEYICCCCMTWSSDKQLDFNVAREKKIHPVYRICWNFITL